MEPDQVEMHQISKSEQPNGKENVVLRTLVGDPNRHKPLGEHPPPTAVDSQEPLPASMYTLETRYRPIPPKVLPKSTGTKVYHIDSQNAEQTSEPSPPITREEPVVLLPAERAPVMYMEEEPQPKIFLEPKIIPQPVLYSIVSAKTLPIPNDQPISIDQEVPSPILYAITGHPNRPTIDRNANTVNGEKTVIDKSPILYNLVGYPRLQVRFQEPVKQVSQQSSTNPTVIVVPQLHEPVKQSSPTFYSIVGNPILIPNITQTNTVGPTPLTKPEKVSSIQPVPILYTIVGETQVPNHIPKQNRPPLAPIKRNINDISMYAVVGDPNIPRSMKIPHKTQPLQLQQPPPPQQQEQVQIPFLYHLVGKPNSLPKENRETRPKPLVRRKSPAPVIVPTRRISRSLERHTAPEPVVERVISMPPIKNKRQPRLKEPTIPKSETEFFPLPEHERTPRPKKPRTTPWYTNPEQGKIVHKPFQIARYDPLRPPDYISPYAYHPSKPYRERTLHPTSLPILANNPSEHKPRPPIYDPRYRAEQKHTYDPWKDYSLERYPVKPQQPSRLWDYEHQAQTDGDDDDTNGLDSSRKSQGYRRYRPRTPWIPVW